MTENVDILSGARMVGKHLISAKTINVIEAIRNYEPTLEVEWVPPEARTHEHQPHFAIKHCPPGQPPYVLMYVQNEEEFDNRVLQRIIVNDQRNVDKTWDQFSAWEEANRRVQEQEWRDKMEAANDIAYHVLRSKKNSYRIDKDTVIKDGIPFNAEGY